MSYLFCTECDHVVSEDELIITEHYEDGYPNPYEREERCPYCGGEDLIDAGRCMICEEAIDPAKNLCDACEEELSEAIDTALRELAEKFCIDYDEALTLLEAWVSANA